MSPTSTNRSPRHRLTDVGDSDLDTYLVSGFCQGRSKHKNLSWVWGRRQWISCCCAMQRMLND
ncbi:MAG: hypothetical protein K2H92_08950 [Bacteroidaceae bacterium]|nr:hypothetical protein [Bacteroidaceae bacterium]